VARSVLERRHKRGRNEMTALELIDVANQVLFVGLFAAVLWRALKQPSRAAWDTVLLFGSIAGVVLLSRAAEFLGLSGQPWLIGLILLLLAVAPYAMLRLVDDFSRTPRWMLLAGGPALAIIGVLGFVVFGAAAQLYEILVIGWFLGVGGYAALAFGRAAIATHGITQRRMTAVAIGTVLFIAAIALAFADVLAETIDLPGAPQIIALFAALSYFLGFAPPAWVRRAWREPDLRNFLERSIHLPTVTDERRAIVEIQNAAATAFGASGAAIGLAVPGHPVLRYVNREGEWVEYADDAFIAGTAFHRQARVVALDASEIDPEHAAVYEQNLATTIIAAPITTEERRVGVLSVYAERAPIFVEDDLWLLELLAAHTGLLLEARTHAAVTSSLRAREESARLKEEFLSAAAHDLRTPLTVVLGQAELLERRLARDPNAPPDAAGVSRMVREARRLRDLVTELLDAQRLEQGAEVMDLEPVDLRTVVESVRRRYHDQGIDLKVTMPAAPVVATIDASRFEQVIDNLVENAIKYGAGGVLPEVELAMDKGAARTSVVDHGVGVPEDERERIFERFYRGSNVQGAAETGIGLGLYICRRIIESHDGRIWVAPGPDGGSVFSVSIPVGVEAVADDAEPSEQQAPSAASGTDALEAAADA
jgi:signal transduction histidine kinase/MFS family permease